MADPQGIFSYPGIDRILGGRYTLSHGSSPGVAVIEMSPQPGIIAQSGTLEITYGSTRIELRNCRVDQVHLNTSRSGHTWTVSILDRRWKWQFGRISGHYNLRNERGELREETRKTAQELAQLLLEEMRETGFSTSDLPDANPEVHWSYANPAEALASLCDLLGCRLVLGLDNKVRIKRVGEGNTLPDDRISQGGRTIDVAETPDSLLVVGGATRYEQELDLEAVGLDTDGKWKPLNDLSYKPAGVWQHSPPGHFKDVLQEHGREAERLALMTVHRYFRIKTGFTPPGEQDPVENLEFVLPTEAGRVTTHVDPGSGEKVPDDPIVKGNFNNGSIIKTDSLIGEKPQQAFRVLAATGLVAFDEYIYQLVDGVVRPAELTIRLAFPLRDKDTREPKRYTLEEQLDRQSGTGPQVIKKEEIIKTIRTPTDDEGGSEPITNEEADQLERHARYYIDATKREYEMTGAASVTWPYFKRIEPDGAIMQVTWELSRSGAITQASRNSEHDLYVPAFKERRRREGSRHPDTASGTKNDSAFKAGAVAGGKVRSFNYDGPGSV